MNPRGARRFPGALALRLAAALLALAALNGPRASSAATPPHIVVILADDLGRADVGFNGGREIQTPHLDALAASGVRLGQFYVQPVCSPTRAALLTGRYPMRHGLQVGVIRPWAQHGLPLAERTLAQALQEAGYRTAMVGKWHLGAHDAAYLPTRRGFDQHYGHYLGAIDYFNHRRDGGLDWHRDGWPLREAGYSTDLMAREAVRILREHPPAKPLFLYVAFNAVHGPLQVPESFKAPYAALREPRRTYAGVLAAMDDAVGRILAELDARGLRTNTLVFFSSDNGGPAPGRITDNGPLRAGKGTLYEGGVRVAACASWPGHIPAGSFVDEPLHIVDLYPTLLKLAGASLRQELPVDGLDIWPVLSRGRRSPHDAILINAEPKRGAVRVGDWKLVLNGARATAAEAEGEGAGDGETEGDDAPRNPGGKEGSTSPRADAAAARPAPARAPDRDRDRDAERVELFHLPSDPGEKTNLAAQEPARVRKLRKAYDRLAAQAMPPQSAPMPRGFRAPKIWGPAGEPAGEPADGPGPDRGKPRE